MRLLKSLALEIRSWWIIALPVLEIFGSSLMAKLLWEDELDFVLYGMMVTPIAFLTFLLLLYNREKEKIEKAKRLRDKIIPYSAIIEGQSD